MPRFYLHLRDGASRIDDPDGMDFSNVDAAKVEAVEGAREIIADMVRAGQPINSQELEIWEAGRFVTTVRFKDVIRLK